MVLGSGIGGLGEIEAQMNRLLTKGPDRVSAFTVPKMMLNAAGSVLAIDFGIRGPNYAVATACASATNAMGDALKLIQDGRADVMITGGTEAAMTRWASPLPEHQGPLERNDDPAGASRPFDADRDGFVFSEGAGLLVFEELEHAKARGARIYAEVYGAGVSPTPGISRSPTKMARGAARAMATRCSMPASNSGPSRLHQRPRHQHAAGRQGRDAGHQDGLRRARPEAEHLQHQEPAGPFAGRQRRHRVGRDHPGAAGTAWCRRRSTCTRPIPTAIWTTRRTSRANAASRWP